MGSPEELAQIEWTEKLCTPWCVACTAYAVLSGPTASITAAHCPSVACRFNARLKSPSTTGTCRCCSCRKQARLAKGKGYKRERDIPCSSMVPSSSLSQAPCRGDQYSADDDLEGRNRSVCGFEWCTHKALREERLEEEVRTVAGEWRFFGEQLAVFLLRRPCMYIIRT